jgi:hypothetical protein
VFACGPDFPNTLLDGGDKAVLTAPVADFKRELDRMKLLPPGFRANPATNSYLQQTVEADLMDLRAALRKAGVPTKQKEAILQAYRTEREKIQHYKEELEKWQEPRWNEDEKSKGAKPEMGEVIVPANLPGEFADYFRGSIAFHADRTNEARMIWEALMERPKAERQFRSTWATYMLGRLADTDEEQIKYYAQVRTLVKEGLRDSLGLATASLGWEAQANLRQKNFEQALELYLQQYSAGDSNAMLSLRFASSDALTNGPATLEALARNPLTRKVITAFVISRAERPRLESTAEATAWLNAVEKAGVRDVESAERLALAAYQNGEMELAQRWVNRSQRSPVSQWLQAKLYLRAGKLDKASAILARLTPAFQIDPTGTNQPPTFQNALYMYYPGDYGFQRQAAAQVLAESGVLRLSRREYAESLDALLRSGYWPDAAYVAERVMSVDELKGYVDSHWPQVQEEEEKPKSNSADGETKEPAEEIWRTGGELPELNERLQRERIRYLLARRLTRLSRGVEARDYFPDKLKTSYGELMKYLTSGHDNSLAQDQRARELFEAAKILRHQGMELMGTELAPDCYITDGNNDLGLTADARRTNESAKVLIPSKDELSRYEQHKADPEVRFHYRYQAAFVALEAAQLLPNDSDETAKMLWTGGTWLKYRDPKTADIFYKALVKRCRNTALGEEADRIRWFPELDERGTIIPGKDRRSKRAAEVRQPHPEEAGNPNESPAPDSAPGSQ